MQNSERNIKCSVGEELQRADVIAKEDLTEQET